MSERHKLEITVIADSDIERAEVRDWVGRVISSLEQQNTVHRTFVNADLTTDEEARKLFQMLDDLSDEDIELAVEFTESLHD